MVRLCEHNPITNNRDNTSIRQGLKCVHIPGNGCHPTEREGKRVEVQRGRGGGRMDGDGEKDAGDLSS